MYDNITKVFAPHARQKALFATVAFGIAALICATVIVRIWQEAIPLLVFHACLIVNTYFSIRCFSSITPKNNLPQHAIDILLGFLLAALPFSFNDPQTYAILATILFAVATTKYILLLKIPAYHALLHKKILIDTLGTLACILALWGIILGYPIVATSIWAFIFFLANIYVLLVNPMYTLQEAQ